MTTKPGIMRFPQRTDSSMQDEKSRVFFADTEESLKDFEERRDEIMVIEIPELKEEIYGVCFVIGGKSKIPDRPTGGQARPGPSSERRKEGVRASG